VRRCGRRTRAALEGRTRRRRSWCPVSRPPQRELHLWRRRRRRAAVGLAVRHHLHHQPHQCAWWWGRGGQEDLERSRATVMEVARAAPRGYRAKRRSRRPTTTWRCSSEAEAAAAACARTAQRRLRQDRRRELHIRIGARRSVRGGSVRWRWWGGRPSRRVSYAGRPRHAVWHARVARCGGGGGALGRLILQDSDLTCDDLTDGTDGECVVAKSVAPL
jgi:hypothetical protein